MRRLPARVLICCSLFQQTISFNSPNHHLLFRTLSMSKPSFSPSNVLDFSPARFPIVDVGINLAHKSFQKDLPSILSRAYDANVTQMVITGTTIQSSRVAQRLITEFERPCRLFCTAGVHPHNAKDCSGNWISDLRHLLLNPFCVAVGETGLDFNRNFSPPHVQEAVFEEQLKLAKECGKPLFCHERDAHSRFVEILDRHPDIEGSRVCVHCFTGQRSELLEYVRRGFFIGFTGCICDSKRGMTLRELVSLVPLTQTLIETDAPFMMPTGGRGTNEPAANLVAVLRTAGGRLTGGRGTNEPANLVAVLRTVASCHGVTEEDAARATTDAAARFFRLPPP